MELGFSVVGIFLEIIGFIFMLRYWKNPSDRHVDGWKEFQKKLHPNDYQERIKDDFNYWRYHKDKSREDIVHEWMVPIRFATFWKNMKLFSLFSILAVYYYKFYKC